MTAFLFPGQGSQKAGMGRDFHEHSPAARAVFDAAERVLGAELIEIAFGADQERLNDTRNAQPALLIVETAIAAHLSARGIRPSVCAGHSLGEIPALTAAAVLGFEDALRLTRERARLMSEDVPEGGMAAVMGLDAEAIAAALPPGAQVANYNGPAQTIISGTKDALAEADAALKAAGAKRVLPLAVSGPFHSELMRPAAERFAGFLRDVPFRQPSVRFVSSVTGGDVADPGRIRELLAEQFFSPVRWTGVMHALGAAPAIEIGPGGVLRGLAKRMEGAAEPRPAGTLAEADAIAADA